MDQRLYHSSGELGADPTKRLAARPAEHTVMMVAPTFFELKYVINPHMADPSGKPHEVDPLLAREQWRKLRLAYEDLGFEVEVAPGLPGLPDMVFAANQSFPFAAPDGQRCAVMSRMRAEERRAEVEPIASFYRSRGFKVFDAPARADDEFLEGGGDLLWVPGRNLVFAGYGFRTSLSLLQFLPDLIHAPVVALKLVDPDFYHLDVALSFLNQDTAFWHPAAFDPESQQILRDLLPNLIDLPEDEAREAFAGNAHCPDGRHVLIDPEAAKTIAVIQDLGFTPVEVDTSEFRKAGGSVFCLKTMLP
ncbi:MAG: arginine deiminase-related protein [Planctomycetota bacterium]